MSLTAVVIRCGVGTA
jgi:hypothetical protein